MAYSWKLPVLFFLAFFLLPIFGIDSVYGNTIGLDKEISKKERQVKELEGDIERRREGLKDLRLRELSLMDELYIIDKRLQKKKGALEDITKKQDTLDRDIRSLEREIKALYIRRSAIEEGLKNRLAAAYKMRDGGVVKVFLSFQDISTIRRRYRYFGALIAYDLNIIREYTENTLTLTMEKEKLEEKRKTLGSLKMEEKVQRDAILKERNRKQAIASKIKSDKELNLVALKRLEEASLRLESKIEELRSRLKYMEESSKNGFAALRGKLHMPAEGKVVSFYGKVEDPNFKTITFNKGIDIEAPEETKVRSIYRGKVIYSDWLKGYGRMIIIDNGGGYYTIFAHLSKTFKVVGDTVEQGEVIALLGDTGSLKGPRLYFEIRHKGVPRDPLEWIVIK